MKAVLNVDGKKLEVTMISYSNGKVSSVQVHLGNHSYKSYQSETNFHFDPSDPSVDFSKQLEFPELEERIVEGNNKLIEHLEQMLLVEDEKLINIAVDAMESDADDLPFTSSSLSNWQKEYKLTQQRVLGIIDAIEEVKAYTEGFYAGKNNSAAFEAENHYAPIE